MPESEDLMTVEEAARELGIGRTTMFKWIREHKIEPVPTNPNLDRRPKLRFKREDVERLKGQAQA